MCVFFVFFAPLTSTSFGRALVKQPNVITLTHVWVSPDRAYYLVLPARHPLRRPCRPHARCSGPPAPRQVRKVGALCIARRVTRRARGATTKKEMFAEVNVSSPR